MYGVLVHGYTVCDVYIIHIFFDGNAIMRAQTLIVVFDSFDNYLWKVYFLHLYRGGGGLTPWTTKKIKHSMFNQENNGQTKIEKNKIYF